jgi:uncharacterized protein with HEPN domain
MNEQDRTRLQDMLDAARKARAFIKGKDRASLEADNFLVGFAVVRALEIVGEAASKVTPETRSTFSQIDWVRIVGMRTRIVHDYLRVDYDIVWQVVIDDVPKLIAELEKIFSEPL